MNWKTATISILLYAGFLFLFAWFCLYIAGQGKIEGEKIERDFHELNPEIQHDSPKSETKKPVSNFVGFFRLF